LRASETVIDGTHEPVMAGIVFNKRLHERLRGRRSRRFSTTGCCTSCCQMAEEIAWVGAVASGAPAPPVEVSCGYGSSRSPQRGGMMRTLGPRQIDHAKD
jgi:hypothetical protein